MLSFLKRYIWKLLKWIRVFIIYRFFKKTTCGVRVLLIDKGEIFLIKHPYDSFWVLPGGGQKKNEDIFQTVKREIQEEGQIEISGDLKKLGEYFNDKEYKNDYISIVVADKWKKSFKKQRLIDKIEIQKSGWFGLDSLPKVSVATQKRISEYLDNDFSKDVRNWN